MHALISYLLKLSISLCIVWLFYQFVLRRLTFYNSNRWYLLFFTALSFCIPFINISGIVNDNSTGENGLIQFIPSVHSYTIALEEATQCPVPLWSTQFDKWDWIAFALMAGAAILFIRFIVRYISFLRIRNKAELISDDGIKIYQVEDSIIPFSFGNSVFINCNQHSSEELEEIVRHEFVHVRQKHTIDIIWAELLCILNWYNPFVWMLKKSIRQNLEFIADNKVIENGINKKEYQYLLLKVIGNNQYSIATQFNFSSLKKRIAMMNKTKSAKRQVIRFLFLLPVLAIILVSFRKSFSDSSAAQTSTSKPVFTDTIPDVKETNSKGYFIDIKDNKGNCVVVIKDKDKKEVKRLLLTDWNAKADYYENLYGEIPPPPPPAKPGLPTHEQWIKAGNSNVKSVSVNNNLARVTLKSGKTENFDLNNADEKKDFENKYGKMPEPPLPPPPVNAGEAAPMPPPPAKSSAPGQPALPSKPAKVSSPGQPSSPAVPSVPPKPATNSNLNQNADFNYNNNTVTVTLKNGKTETYNLADPVQNAEFKTIYDKPVVAPVEVRALTGVQVTNPVKTQVTTGTKSNKPVTVAATTITNGKLASVIADSKTVTGAELAAPVLDKPITLTGVKSSGSVIEKAITIDPVKSTSKPSEAYVVESDIVNIAGLTTKNEERYILLDGKEYNPPPGTHLKGSYRITFMDKIDAVKQYGDKAKNGAMLLETIKNN